MEKKLLKELRKLVEKYGYAYTANKIKELDTQNLKRWLKENNIPKYKVNTISEFIRR